MNERRTEDTTHVSGDVPPTRSSPVSKMDSPYSARFRLARTGEKSRQHSLTGGLQMGGAREAPAALPIRPHLTPTHVVVLREPT